MAERYGSYLKSDILQITHHGFNGGSMEAYALVNPDVCLAPVDEETFFCNMGYYHKSNQSLIYHLNVQDFCTCLLQCTRRSFMYQKAGKGTQHYVLGHI